ncbi:Protein of unknown function [Lactobacillus delbrueckii subsp. bulgaricus]|nr:Protein of unknown function [Lactobacillus delbrueckii subsp. bulgaricus]CDR75580.1 Protein of unknown function [Lactobacillus delbrueckii subsp. bulgaricus]
MVDQKKRPSSVMTVCSWLM